MNYTTLAETCQNYADTPEAHTALWNAFLTNVNATPTLKNHRDFVEKYEFGYGERPFHWAWKIILDSLPQDFSFCEVGVFQGQVLSLVAIVAKELQKEGKIVGISPLNTSGDKYKPNHANIDYIAKIRTIHQRFGIHKSPVLIVGHSFDPRVQVVAKEEGPYDCMYIDGCHDYEVVVDDLQSYGAMLKPGGLLVVDDAADYLNLPKGVMPMDWKGLEDVSKATRDVIEQDPNFEHLFAVGHLRVFRRKQ